MRKCRIGTAKFFTLLLLLYRTSVKKEEIHISYENGILSLGAKKEDRKDADDTEHHYIRRERASVSFSRQFTVKGIKEEGIKAALKDGILTIMLPKEEEKKAEPSRQITID